MNRRSLMGATLAVPAALMPVVLLTGTASAEILRNEINQLLIEILMRVEMNDRAGARRVAEQFPQLANRDPNWSSYRASFEIARFLAQTTDPRNREAWIRVNVLILQAYPGSAQELSMFGAIRAGGIMGAALRTAIDRPHRDNIATAAVAAYEILRTEFSGPPLMTGDRRAEYKFLASWLLSITGWATGPQRTEWAQLGRRVFLENQSAYYQQRSPQGEADLDRRGIAAAFGVAGDWRGASEQYEALLPTSAGAETSTGQPTSSQLAGLLDSIMSTSTLEGEAATAFAMNGQFDHAVETMEQARWRASAPSNVDFTPLQLESILGRNGSVIVQPVVGLTGAFALVSVFRGGVLRRFTAFNPENGGLEMYWRLIATQPTDFNLNRDGVVPTYMRARRAPEGEMQGALQHYVSRAAADAEALIGSTIRQALIQAQVRSTDDVVVVLPASLAVLPISLAQQTDNGATLGEQYQLRFVDSLAAAASSRSNAALGRDRPSCAVVSPATGLQHTSFEVAFVSSAFPSESLTRVAPGSDGATLLAALDGTDYWHIASHSSWDYRNADRSGIALGARNLLTIGNIQSALMQRPPRLVYLSACETGLIDIRRDLNRFLSFPTALMAKGVGGAISSLWPVSDAASAVLSVKFYDEHLGQRVAPARALKSARAWLKTASAPSIQEYVTTKVAQQRVSAEDAASIAAYLGGVVPASAPFSDAYYWGGFTLYGC